MNLNSFRLENYMRDIPSHRTVIVKLHNDQVMNKTNYLGDLDYHIQKIEKRKEENYINGAYIAFYHNRAIGFISLTVEDESYQISYGIIPEFRGFHIGALLLQEFTEKIFETYKQIDKLTLIINSLNTGSKKTALLAGYEKENDTRYTQHRM